MNYIYNIKHIHNNYMFHDKELIVNDIVWGYEPKGKRVKGYCLGNCEDCVSAKWGCNGWEQDEPSIYGCERGLISYHPDYENLYEGTGKVIAKYKVVEVHCKDELDRITQYNLDASEDLCECGWRDETYIYKLEKIEDVSMELSEFVSWNKINLKAKSIAHNVNGWDYNKAFNYWKHWDNFTLTRYNGLTKVILRSEKE